MTAIAITIFVLFALGSVSLVMRDRARTKAERDRWHRTWLVLMLLEVEAMKARDKARENARTEQR